MMILASGRALMVFISILASGGWPETASGLKQDDSNTPLTVSAPDWFNLGNRSAGKSDFICVSTAGKATQALAEQELLALLKGEIEQQIAVWQDRAEDDFPQLTSHFIREKLIVGDHFVVLPYEDDLTRAAASVGGGSPTPYYKGFAEVELTPKFREWVVQWRRQPVLREMLGLLGILAGTVIGLIAILFGYLRIEQVTHSHYTKRLQFASLGALLVLGVAVYQLIRLL